MWMTWIYRQLDLTRDSLALFWTKWISFCCLAMTLGLDLHAEYDWPIWLVRLVQLTAALAMGSAAQHRTSDLPRK